MDPRISVLIVLDVCLYREGVTRALAQVPTLAVVGSVAEVEEGETALRELHPRVLLLDPGASGAAELARRIGVVSPETRIVALGVREVEREVMLCAEAGMAGYVAREASIADLVVAIESAARGELRCSPRIAASLFRRVAVLAEGGREPEVVALTRREEEIVLLIDQGLSNKQIAGRLRIELSTVKNHVHNLLRKLNASRRGLAAARARRSRLEPVTPSRSDGGGSNGMSRGAVR